MIRHFKRPHFLVGFSVVIASNVQNVLPYVNLTPMHQVIIGSVLGAYIMFLGRAKNGE